MAVAAGADLLAGCFLAGLRAVVLLKMGRLTGSLKKSGILPCRGQSAPDYRGASGGLRAAGLARGRITAQIGRASWRERELRIV